MQKKTLFFSILYLVFVVIFITCNKEPELSGGIYGIVTDNTGKPIPNAVVQFNLLGTQIWQSTTLISVTDGTQWNLPKQNTSSQTNYNNVDVFLPLSLCTNITLKTE